MRRALGPSGVPVQILVVDRSNSYPKVTTFQYDHDSKRVSEMIVADPAVDHVPLGSELAYRLDPQNPKFLVRADAPLLGSVGKQIICIIVIVAGALIFLDVIDSWIR